MNNSKVKISFGIIVLNGEPFTKYCLRSLYDFAHEIIIVEGATKNAKAISTPEGHSKDSTLKSINEFIREEDKEKKVKLITRNGYFEGKNEMSIAYAEVATGNYLWQIDIDEFYLKEDMQKIVSLLEKDPSITAISFKTMPFWGSVDYIEEGPILGDFHRLFKFGPGYKYIEHRPPTVLDNNGNNLRNLKHLDGTTMAGHYGIYLYHYYLIFPLQAKVKTAYYSQTFHKDYYKWLNDNYINFKDPYHVNDNFWKISWLRKYKGSHPEQIVKMIDDIKTGKINAEMRENHDIDKVLNSFKYRTVTLILRIYFGLLSRIKRCIKKVLWSFNIRKTLKMPRFIKKTLKNSVLFPALSLVMKIYTRLLTGFRRDKGVILAYHRVADVSEDPSQLCVSVEKFNQQMKYIKRKFNVISLSDLIKLIKNKSSLKNTLVITFDDGYYDNLANALPILEKYQIPATIFVTAGKIDDPTPFPWETEINEKDRGRALTSEELKEISQSPLIEIGGHTMTHPSLSSLTKQEQKSEIIDSKILLENLTGKKVTTFAFPFGAPKYFNQDSKNILKESDFLCSCMCEGGYINHNSDLYSLPRNIVRNWSLFMLKFFSL